MRFEMPDKSRKITLITLLVCFFVLVSMCTAVATTVRAEEVSNVVLKNIYDSDQQIGIRNGLNLIAVLRPECKDCNEELPLLVRLASDYSQVKMTIIIYGKGSDAIPAYAGRFNLNPPVIYADPLKLTKTAFNISYLPFLLYADASGKILATYESSGDAMDYSGLTKATRHWLSVTGQ